MRINMNQPELEHATLEQGQDCIKVKLETGPNQNDTTVASRDSGVLVDKSLNNPDSLDSSINGSDREDADHQVDEVETGNEQTSKESVFDAVLGANDQELAKRQYDDDDPDEDDDDAYDCLPKSKRLATGPTGPRSEPQGLNEPHLDAADPDSSRDERSPSSVSDGGGRPRNPDTCSSSNRPASHREFGEDGKQPDEPEQMRKLFIGGLDWKTSEETLKRHFEKFGEVMDCVVMRDPQTKRSRGFGFVIYAKSFMVDRAQEARPHELDGREVQPKRAISREESGKPESEATVKKVYLGGLSDDIDEAELRDYFKEFGNIININIVAHKDTGKRRGFAFVEYDDWDPVDKIVLKKFHTIKDKRVEAKKAIPKVEMDARKRADPRAAMSSSMMSLPGSGGGGGPPQQDGRGIRARGGPFGSGYLWDAPYGAGLHHVYPAVGLDGYPPHYHSAHYGAHNWMMHGGQADVGPYGFRGSHAGYGRNGGYPSQAAVAAAAAAAAAAASGWPDYAAGGFPPSESSLGVGPMRHLASHQHRSYRPYANGDAGGYGLGGGGGFAKRGGRGFNPQP